MKKTKISSPLCESKPTDPLLIDRNPVITRRLTKKLFLHDEELEKNYFFTFFHMRSICA